MCLRLKEGDEVAIMPCPDSQPEETIEIAIVRQVGIFLIELPRNRLFTRSDGKSLAPQEENYIVPATNAHRLALRDSNKTLPIDSSR